MSLVDFLASLSAGQWVAVAFASWTIAACVIAVPLGRSMRDPEPEWYQTEGVWTYPVIEPDDDAAWLLAWPTDLTDDVVNARISELEAQLAEADQ